MGLFLSRFVNKIDKKGRISVPAPFRAALSDQSFAGIVVYPHPKLPALEGCGLDRMVEMVEGHDRLDQFSDQRDDLGSVFAMSHQLSFDPEGRVMLPEDLLAHAGITEQAVFAGSGRTFQIWEPQSLDRHLSEARDRIRIQRTTLPTARSEGSGK